MSIPLAQAAARQLWAAVRMLVVMTVILGLAYPLAMTGFAQALFPHRADGSLVKEHGTLVGSSLIGQSFGGEPQYFQSRPSAAGHGYDPLASSASNLGPESKDLVKAVQERRTAAAELDGTDPAQVAPDALLASGSGLDPQISPAYAAQQVDRVARVRGLRPATVRALVATYTDGRTLGFLGEPRVNVLLLNLALDRETGTAD
jgi:K+-transporting ATPase ATPase C chain